LINLKLKAVIVYIVTIAVVLIAIGELVNTKIHNKNHEATFTDIQKMKNQQKFNPNDLIITQTGADHVCNWFLGVKAGVITSLNIKDFNRYNKIYVLNTIFDEQAGIKSKGETYENESDKYSKMFKTIVVPNYIVPVFKTEYLVLYPIESPINEWKFNNEGDWIGYSE
jgi:hypothetical protein